MRYSGLAGAALLLLAACQTQAAKPGPVLTADEAEARAWCQDAMPTDVRYAGGESIYDACVSKFLYDRKRGWR